VKQIKVNEKCSGCGLCIVSCPYLQENADGNAEFIVGKSIASSDLDTVKKVISECPQNALELVDTSSTKKKGKAGVHDIISKLEKALEDFNVPPVTKADIPFKVEDYYIHVPTSNNEFKNNYSSERAAKSAARDEFDRLCYSESAYRPMLKKVFVEYKVKKLKPYYTITDTADSAYFKYNNQIRELLANSYTEITELIGDKIPESWKEFAFYPRKSESLIELLMEFDDQSTNLGIITEFRSMGKFTAIDWYVDKILIDDSDIYVGEGLFGKSKYKRKYRFCGFNPPAEEFISDLKSAISNKASNITDTAVNWVNEAIRDFETKVKKEFRKKIEELEAYLK